MHFVGASGENLPGHPYTVKRKRLFSEVTCVEIHSQFGVLSNTLAGWMATCGHLGSPQRERTKRRQARETACKISQQGIHSARLSSTVPPPLPSAPGTSDASAVANWPNPWVWHIFPIDKMAPHYCTDFIPPIIQGTTCGTSLLCLCRELARCRVLEFARLKFRTFTFTFTKKSNEIQKV